MKLTFKMTGEEYYLGWKFKFKDERLKKIISLILAVCIFVGFLILLKSSFTIYMIAISMLVFILFMNQSEKKSVIAQYYSSPVKNSEHTICVYDEGIELINSYEKSFAPWQSIYKVKETSENIIILLSYARGIAVINKKRYFSPELDSIMNAIKSHITVEEGK